MRVLKFIIDGLKLTKDSQCDFSGIVPGTKGYLKAEFKFNEDWYNCNKMAVFTVPGSQKEVPVRIENTHCVIPDDVLIRRSFKVRVIGVKPGLRLPTNNLEVKQDG